MTNQTPQDLAYVDENVLRQVIDLCRMAGAETLKVYHRSEGMTVDTKADDSPVTEADLAAHAVLEPGLTKIDTDIPVLSEESELPSFEQRSAWTRYWIIDPLDGTKEFINHNGEYTINVALIENGEAVLGVVYVPVYDVTYAGIKGFGAFKIENGKKVQIQTRSIASRQRAQAPVELVASRRHGAEEVERLIEKVQHSVGHVSLKSMGSSLKLCLVAEGQADLYPRLAPTSEWDTAAAQAVVEAAGGVVTDTQFQPLKYNTKESILNPSFYVIGDTGFNWQEVLG